MTAISKAVFRGWRNEVRFIVGTPEDLAADRGEEALTLVDARLRYTLSRRTLCQAVKDRRILAVGMVGNAALYRASDIAALTAVPENTERHPAWTKLSAKLLTGAACAACGRTRDLMVHHIIPVSVDRTRELDTSNLIVLCRDDHLFIGHGSNWHRHNTQVVADAATILTTPTMRAEIEVAIARRVKPTANAVIPLQVTAYDHLSVTAVVGSSDSLSRGEGVTAVSAAEAAMWLRVTKARIFQIIHEWNIQPIAAYANIQFFDAARLKRALVGPREPEIRDTRFDVTFDPTSYLALGVHRQSPVARKVKTRPRKKARPVRRVNLD